MKLFEHVDGNQFKVVKEVNPEAWRGHEAPSETDPPESMEDGGIWATIRDAKESLTDFENELKSAQVSNDENKFFEIYDRIQRFADTLESLFNNASNVSMKNPQVKKEIGDIWKRLNNILE